MAAHGIFAVDMSASANPAPKRKPATRTPRPDAIDRAVSETVRRARRRAFAEGLVSITAALFGKTQQAVLGLLFGRSEGSFCLRELVAAAKRRSICCAAARAQRLRGLVPRRAGAGARLRCVLSLAFDHEIPLSCGGISW